LIFSCLSHCKAERPVIKVSFSMELHWKRSEPRRKTPRGIILFAL